MNTIETMTNMNDKIQKKKYIKELNIEYNELYPQYLDSYRRWKSLMSTDKTINSEEAYNEHIQLENKLNNINNELLKKSMQNTSDVDSYIEEQNETLENNEKKIEQSSTNIYELNDVLDTNNNRIEDYQILNRNKNIKVVLWVFLTLIILCICIMMAIKYYK